MEPEATSKPGTAVTGSTPAYWSPTWEDGATLTRSLVRRQGDNLIGHTSVRTQLTWCRKEGVPAMIVTHCGSRIVKGDERTLGAELRKMGRERGVQVTIAHDGMTKVLR